MALTCLMTQMAQARLTPQRPKAFNCRMYKFGQSWPDFDAFLSYYRRRQQQHLASSSCSSGGGSEGRSRRCGGGSRFSDSGVDGDSRLNFGPFSGTTSLRPQHQNLQDQQKHQQQRAAPRQSKQQSCASPNNECTSKSSLSSAYTAASTLASARLTLSQSGPLVTSVYDNFNSSSVAVFITIPNRTIGSQWKVQNGSIMYSIVVNVHYVPRFTCLTFGHNKTKIWMDNNRQFSLMLYHSWGFRNCIVPIHLYCPMLLHTFYSVPVSSSCSIGSQGRGSHEYEGERCYNLLFIDFIYEIHSVEHLTLFQLSFTMQSSLISITKYTMLDYIFVSQVLQGFVRLA